MQPSGNAGRAVRAALVTFFLLVNVVSAGATTYNVTNASGLAAAVAAANANLGPDVINMAPGVYTFDVDHTGLEITDDLTINGGARPGTVIAGPGIGLAAFDVHVSFSSTPTNNNIHAIFNNLTIQDFHPGIAFSSGPASLFVVNGCTITGSYTTGVYVSGGPTHILNSTFSGNDVGLYIESGDSVLAENVTIADNNSTGIVKYGGPLTVRNSIVAFNTTDCESHPNAADHSICGDGSCGPGFVVADPMIGTLVDHGGPTATYELAAGSPALDAGSGCVATDQRGVPRPQGAACDIGSFEWTALPFTSVTASLSPGGSITTDTLGTGATAANPVQTTLTAPNGGNITIEQGPGAADFGFLGQTVQINASPDATPANPFAITFTIDASAIPSGQSAATIVVDKNAVAVPPCGGSPGIASPNPCVSSRQTIAGGDAQITVLSSTASTWKFAGGTTASVGGQPQRLEFSVYPNPVRRAATVRLALPQVAFVNLSVFDPAGRKVATLLDGREPAGLYSVAWSGVERLPAGLYFVRLRAGTQLRTATVIRVN